MNLAAPAASVTATIPSPLGSIRIVLDERDRVTELHLGARARPAASRHPVALALARYFAGDLDALEEIAVAPLGTPFQLRVLGALRRVRAGRTVSYGEIARRIGRPTACRAVAGACRTNPVGLIIPCHRVIGADGSLTGFAGGIEKKRWLLEHESAPHG